MTARFSADWSDEDVRAFVDGCARNQVHPLHVLACMFNESDARADARNPRDASKPAVAVGLIQFTHAYLGAGADLDAFRLSGTSAQLHYVERYFAPSRGRLTTVELVYCSMFLPAWVPKSPTLTTPLCAPQGPFAWAYMANRSLDVGHKGHITLVDLRIKANGAATGPRWTELAGRVLTALQDRETDPRGGASQPDSDPPVLVPDTLGHEDDPPPDPEAA